MMPMKLQLKLYEITDELLTLLDQVDEETGELPPEIDAITANFKTKGAGVAAYVLNMKAEVEARKELIKKLQSANRSAETRMASLQNYLEHQMSRAGISKIEANDKSFKAVLYKDRDEYVDIYEEKLISNDYLRTIPETKVPDKVSIKKALKAGIEIQGARLVTKDRLEIK